MGNTMDKKEAAPSEKKAALQAINAQFNGTDNRTQCLRLLEALAGHAVNTFEASRFLDVYHPPARILQLRKAGHRITTHWQTVATESGRKHRVGLYVLESAVRHE
jgi:Helix-turn-helix domain